MANTDPVADTAGVVEQVWRLGREAGHCDVQPGRRGHRRAGGRAAGRARRDGRLARPGCGSSPTTATASPTRVLMRRALEYVKAFDGVIAQHAQEPRLTEGAQMNEGELSGVLGLHGLAGGRRGGDHRPRRAARRARRLAGCTSATSRPPARSRSCAGPRARAGTSPPRSPRTTCCSPTSWPRSYDPVFKVNPPLRTAEDVAALRAALADGTIDAVATDHAPHALEDKECEWAAAAIGMLGLETALSVVLEAMVETGLLDWAGVADRMSARPARIGRLDDHGRPLEAGAPANLMLVDPAARRDVDPFALASPQPQHAVRRARRCPARSSPPSCAAEPTVLDGKLAVSGRRRRAARARGRPHVPRRGATARSARRSARRSSPPA